MAKSRKGLIAERLTENQANEIRKAFRRQYPTDGQAYADVLLKNWHYLAHAAILRNAEYSRRRDQFPKIVSAGPQHKERLAGNVTRYKKKLQVARDLLDKTVLFLEKQSATEQSDVRAQLRKDRRKTPEPTLGSEALSDAKWAIQRLEIALDVLGKDLVRRPALYKRGENFLQACLADELRLFFADKGWVIRSRPSAAFCQVICVAAGLPSINTKTMRRYLGPLRVQPWELGTRLRRGEVVASYGPTGLSYRDHPAKVSDKGR